jgi:hypothetical protein
MPFDERLGLDEDQGVTPIKETRQRDDRQPKSRGCSPRFGFPFLEPGDRPPSLGPDSTPQLVLQ